MILSVGVDSLNLHQDRQVAGFLPGKEQGAQKISPKIHSKIQFSVWKLCGQKHFCHTARSSPCKKVRRCKTSKSYLDFSLQRASVKTFATDSFEDFAQCKINRQLRTPPTPQDLLIPFGCVCFTYSWGLFAHGSSFLITVGDREHKRPNPISGQGEP